MKKPTKSPVTGGFQADLKRWKKESPEFAQAHDEQLGRLELARSVRLRRERFKLTQEELGKRAGILQPNIARLERGNANVSIKTVERVARALQARPQIRLIPTGVDEA